MGDVESDFGEVQEPKPAPQPDKSKVVETVGEREDNDHALIRLYSVCNRAKVLLTKIAEGDHKALEKAKDCVTEIDDALKFLDPEEPDDVNDILVLSMGRPGPREQVVRLLAMCVRQLRDACKRRLKENRGDKAEWEAQLEKLGDDNHATAAERLMRWAGK